MEDHGRFPDGSCESCGSVMHGLADCPDMACAEPRYRHRNGKSEATHACRHASLRERRDAKREARRARRRIERLDPENAPTRMREVTRGWAD